MLRLRLTLKETEFSPWNNIRIDGRRRARLSLGLSNYALPNRRSPARCTSRRTSTTSRATPRPSPCLACHYGTHRGRPAEKNDANYLLDTKLAAQLQYLVDNNYYYPSYAEGCAPLPGWHTLPGARSVVLTFDDGQMGFLNYGIPLLEQYEVPATSFIICSQDSTPEKLRDYASPYVSFQSHSYNMHRDGSDVGRGGIIHAMTTEEIVDDLKQAQAILGTTEAFAYPYGDNNENAWAAMEEAGVLCAFTIENRRVEVGDPVEGSSQAHRRRVHPRRLRVPRRTQRRRAVETTSEGDQ